MKGFISIVFSLWLAFPSVETINAMLLLPSRIPVQLQIPEPPPPPPKPTLSYPNCRNQALGRIIAANIKKDARISQQAVAVAVKEMYQGPWYVTCGYDYIAFSTHSPNYCEYTNGDVYCYVFQPYRF